MSKTVLIILGLVLFVAVSCKLDREDHHFRVHEEQSTSFVYPQYLDDNSNGINDYVEKDTHLAGYSLARLDNATESTNQTTAAIQGHEFVDNDGDGICDYAEDGSPTWHGPGFVDEDEDGVCDFWDENSSVFNHHEGLRYQDSNGNGINDYVEENTHESSGHDFIDKNGDRICDEAQNGSSTWHGPGFMDDDHDGICDHWQPGGHGYGHHS
ncbi:MAG: hypothetical protein HQ517_10310 [SAR324 cluster bacterium]|nr:hypothetical protein [SAR324 cluster bacterium]